MKAFPPRAFAGFRMAEKNLLISKPPCSVSHFGTPVLNRFVKFIESFHQKV
jgi:hypothetical protein